MDRIPHDDVPGVYPSTPDYAHAVELRGVERLVFVSGTMGLDAEGAAGRTLEEQLELVWSNIRRILASAGMTVDNIVRLSSFLRDASYAGPNAAARLRALGGRRIPTTAIVVGTLEPDWLVEIEVVAAA